MIAKENIVYCKYFGIRLTYWKILNKLSKYLPEKNTLEDS